jgi:hypothetical protein
MSRQYVVEAMARPCGMLVLAFGKAVPRRRE